MADSANRIRWFHVGSESLRREGGVRGTGSGRRLHAVALAIYLALSLAMLGRGVLGHLGQTYIGHSTDPLSFVWWLYWWPFALAHHLNPFLTSLVWAPQGVNLTWTTSIPAVSLLAAPLTLTLGPVATYNILMLLAPALAAWAAYLLVRHLTGRFWPSFIGGYLFGFSSYEIGQLQGGHLNLVLVFLLPLAVYLFLLLREGAIGRPVFVILTDVSPIGRPGRLKPTAAPFFYLVSVVAKIFGRVTNFLLI